MLNRRLIAAVLAAILVVWVTVTALTLGVGADDQVIHTVTWQETITSIARMYGVTVQAIVDANKLTNANVISVGQKLIIPSQPGQVSTHVVVAGESLTSIAAKYGLSVWDIAVRNGIANINLIVVGQSLIIPAPATVVQPSPVTTTIPVTGTVTVAATATKTVTATVKVTTTPVAPATPCSAAEAIIISAPLANANVKCPIIVAGWGSAFENHLAVDVLNAAGNTIAQSYAYIKPAGDGYGYGPFTGTISCTTTITQAELGRIQVYSISPRDGAIEHLSSVTVNLKP